MRDEHLAHRRVRKSTRRGKKAHKSTDSQTKSFTFGEWGWSANRAETQKVTLAASSPFCGRKDIRIQSFTWVIEGNIYRGAGRASLDLRFCEILILRVRAVSHSRHSIQIKNDSLTHQPLVVALYMCCIVAKYAASLKCFICFVLRLCLSPSLIINPCATCSMLTHPSWSVKCVGT